MKDTLSQQLAQFIDKNQTLVQPSYTIEASIAGGKISPGFHQWADGNLTHGGFLIRNLEGNAYWLVFIDWKGDNDYYLILFNENHNKPIAEIHQVNITQFGEEFSWDYRPVKRDGKNAQRKDYFTEYFYDTNVRISLPKYPSELMDFLDELFYLAENRIKADELDSNLPDYRDSFPEGKRYQKLHFIRERNPKIVRIAKQNFLQKHGRLFCEVCDFDFEKKYGKHGKGFIEAHHTIPISELKSDGEETKVEDIALVCSNCHRILHRYRPWLSIADLKKLLVRNL